MRFLSRALAVSLSAALALSPLASAAELSAVPSAAPAAPDGVSTPLSLPELSLPAADLAPAGLPLDAAAPSLPALAVPAASPAAAERAVAAASAASAAAAAAPPGVTAAPVQSPARAAVPAARAALASAGRLAARRATKGSSWARFWSGAQGPQRSLEADAAADEPAVDASLSDAPSPASRLSPAKPRTASGRIGPRLAAAAALVPAAGRSVLPHWALPYWSAVRPYAAAGGVFAATYAVNRVVGAAIDRLAKSRRWDANRTDTARFAGSVASWALGAAAGLKLAGASTTAIAAGFGVALTLAVKTTVSNVMQAVVFLLNRPFVIGETVRIGDRLCVVEDMQLQYVKLRVVGQLVTDKPDPIPAGFKVEPLSAVDPLGRAVDDRGAKWVLERLAAPGPDPDRPGPQAEHFLSFSYSLLAMKSITVFRAYHTTGGDRRRRALSEAPRRRVSVGAVLQAVAQSPLGALAKAVLWTAGAVALGAGLPWLNAHLAWGLARALLPYAHGLAVLGAAHAASRYAQGFVPVLAKRLGWSREATVVAKLLSQVVVYCLGLSSGLRASGLQWKMVATSLGVTAAALTFASSGLLGSLADALLIRFNRPFKVGDTIKISDVSGVVEEINMFYVVLRTDENVHTLVPYFVFDWTEFSSFEPQASRRDDNPNTPPQENQDK